MTVTGNASISLPGGGIYVDSNSSRALTANGNAKILASVVDVHGGVKVDGRNVIINAAPTIGAPILADPLASLAQPSTSGLTNYGSVNLTGGALTINPGIYKQISVSGTGALTMNSGVYIIEGGDFSVTGQGIVTGSQVMVFNAASMYPATGGSYGSLNVSGLASVTLTPPSAGPYAGIVYFQSRDNKKTASVSGNGIVASLRGVFYAPAAEVMLTGNAMLETTILVDDLFMSGNADPSSIPYSTLLEEIASRRTAAVDQAAPFADEVFAAGEAALQGGPLSAMTTQAAQRQRSEADRPGNATEEPEMRLSNASQAKVQTPGTRGKRSPVSIVDKLFAAMGELDNLF